MTVREHLPPEAQAFFGRDRAWCATQAERIGPSCVALIDPAQGAQLALPFGLESIDIQGRCSRQMWALVHSASGSQERVRKYDITLADALASLFDPYVRLEHGRERVVDGVEREVAIGNRRATRRQRLRLRGGGLEAVGEVLADHVSGEWCELVARSLAPLRDAGGGGDERERRRPGP